MSLAWVGYSIADFLDWSILPNTYEEQCQTEVNHDPGPNPSSLHQRGNESAESLIPTHLIRRLEKYASVSDPVHRAIRPGLSPSFRSFTMRHGWSALFT